MPRAPLCLLKAQLMGCVAAALTQLCLSLVLLTLPPSAQAQATALTLQSLHQPVPGGVAIVALPTTNRTPPKVTFQQKPVLVVAAQEQIGRAHV